MRKLILVTALSTFLPLSASAVPLVIDFDTDASGAAIIARQILDTEYSAWGVHISVDNQGGGPDLGVAFDTEHFTGGDDDLSHPFIVGNATDRNYGHVLIIQENGGDGNGDGFIDVDPDDEGSRPAGPDHVRPRFPDQLRIVLAPRHRRGR